MEWQNPPDADVILRASGGKEFHAHKLVLSLASPIFRDVFSLALPTKTELAKPPIVDVHDPPEALEIFLQIIYPMRNPSINDPQTLASVLRLADKYDAKAVLDDRKDYALSIPIDPLPIHLYVVFSACGREKEAEAAARRVPFTSLAVLSGPLLPLMTVEHYQRLIELMVTRAQQMRRIVDQFHREINSAIINGPVPHPCGKADHQLYTTKIVAAVQAAFEADPCARVVEAIGAVLSAPDSKFPPCNKGNCSYPVEVIRQRAERLLGALVEMAKKLTLTGPGTKAG